jgi:hypothetical protein
LTVQMVTGRSAQEIGPAERQRLVDALAGVLADLPPFTLAVGSVLAGMSGVLADVDADLPGQPFHEVYIRVRAAIVEVCGPAAVAADTLPPHLSLGYGIGPGDSGRLQGLLRRRVRPSHAVMTVRQVHVVDVVQDADRSEYRWTPVARVPLGTALPGTGGVGA